MVFNSPVFIFMFLPLALMFYHLSPLRLKNPVLLALSLVFFAWGDSGGLLVLLLAIALNLGLGLLIESGSSPGTRRAWFAASLGLNLLLLIYYKYLGFILGNLVTLKLASPDALKLTQDSLPLGISYFTFQFISYAADIQAGRIKACRDPVKLGLYVAFFPKLVAGPILRFGATALDAAERKIDFAGFSQGIKRFAFGFGKKALLASLCGQVADAAFKTSALDLDWATAWLGIICYTFQIYFDFSGYTDMAVGLGRMFGFILPENFNYPYVSRSVQEFWRRWHITLSLWFRDYLYIPLGGSRKGELRTYLNLLTVFTLCGLWHGASWSFVFWGLWHGFFLTLERLFLIDALKRLPRFVSHVYLMLAIILGWVFFRSPDLSQALGYIGAMFTPGLKMFDYFQMTNVTRTLELTLVLAALLCLPLWPWLEEKLDASPENPGGLKFWPAASSLAALLVLGLSLMQLALNTYSPFIYAKF